MAAQTLPPVASQTPAPARPRETSRPSATLPPPTRTPAITPALTASPAATGTPTPTATLTPTPTVAWTPTITPTYAILTGKVLLRANCRYGPGAPFLYKYGLLEKTRMDVIGRNPSGSWLLIQARGGTNPCWIKASLMEVNGDVMAVEPVDPDIILPWSPYYGALSGVSAVRKGNTVTVFWLPLNLRAGDDSEQTPYLIEAWVCVDGKLEFTVVGSYTTAAEIIDEPGCTQPSHGRVYGAEKHGYTPWTEIPWPPP
ncbi:MAG: hypothetical protein ACOYYS_24395 [Chloroflexota bacterium]